MLSFVLLVSCVILILLIIRRNKNYWKKRDIFQVNKNIIWNFIKSDCSIPEIVSDIYNEHDHKVIGTFSGGQPVLVLKDLDDVQAVLAGDFQSFYSRGILTSPKDILSDNILFMDDYKRWKCLRQKLSPVFTSSRLKNMFYIMDKCAKNFAELLEENKDIMKDKKPYDNIYKYTTAALAASVFGIDTFPKNSIDSPFEEMTKNSIEFHFITLINLIITSWMPKLVFWLNLKIFGEYEEFFVGVVRNVLNSRRDETVKRHDFIDICLELQAQGTMKDASTGYELEPTVEVLAAQAFFFFLAGADTSANTMHFTLLTLAAHQEVLAKVHSEIDSVFSKANDELTYNDIEKLQYLNMVISESMRIYPTIGSIQRRCTKDTVLPGTKTMVYKDEVVMISIYGIHRDEKYYPDPDTFDPKRFAPENEKKMKNCSFLAFGEGNRMCLGARFARLQLTAGLAWLLRKYTLAEQKYAPTKFDRSVFSIRDINARYELIPRNF